MDFDDLGKLGKKLERAADRLVSGARQQGPAIRLMQWEDLDEVLRLIRLHDSDDYQTAKRAFSRARFDLPLDVTAHYVIIDPAEQRVVGVSGYYIDDEEARGVYGLGWTYINPFFRGRGLGKALMAHVTEQLRRMGARKLYLTTSSLPKYADAVGFYQRCGFEEEGRLLDYFQQGEHKLIMGLRLQGAQLAREVPRSAPVTPAPARPAPAPAPKRRDEGDDDGGGGGVVFEF